MAKKTVLITGASRGIGAATAMVFAEKGFSVCVNFHTNKTAAISVVEQIERAGGEAFYLQADVSREDEVVALFEKLDTKGAQLTVLVNNAGILLPQSRLINTNAERINTLLTTNVTSCFLCCREAILRMSTQRGGNGGSIVNVSSAASRLGSPGEYIDYAATKGAIDTLTIGLANEVAQENIRVNAVRPGFIDTTMHADGGEPERLQRLKSSIPLRRGGTVEEVAQAIYWLASDKASYSTGSFLDVAGGR